MDAATPFSPTTGNVTVLAVFREPVQYLRKKMNQFLLTLQKDSMLRSGTLLTSTEEVLVTR